MTIIVKLEPVNQQDGKMVIKKFHKELSKIINNSMSMSKSPEKKQKSKRVPPISKKIYNKRVKLTNKSNDENKKNYNLRGSIINYKDNDDSDSSPHSPLKRSRETSPDENYLSESCFKKMSSDLEQSLLNNNKALSITSLLNSFS